MLARTMITTTKNSVTRIELNKPPNIICGGFIDINGIWNNGFACPLENFVQYFCCGTDNYHYCCSPDHYITEINSYNNDQVYITGQYRSSNHIIIDQRNNTSLINNSNMINKQFEQFQKLFLPIFLLTSSILFLVGIAIWFWLYKHKAFYAVEQDDLNEQNQIIRKKSHSLPNELITKKRNSINLTMDQQSRHISHPSTEV